MAALQRDLQAARYAAQRAQKQYDAADPENRLVADELERRWNHALQRVREVELRIEQQVPASGQSTMPGAEDLPIWQRSWRRCGVGLISMYA